MTTIRMLGALALALVGLLAAPALADDITEAMDREGALFGSARLRQALASLPAQPSVRDITAQVRGHVGQFVAEAEPSDDLAILALHWIGRPNG